MFYHRTKVVCNTREEVKLERKLALIFIPATVIAVIVITIVLIRYFGWS